MNAIAKHQEWLEWLDAYLGKKGFSRVSLQKSQNCCGRSWYASWTRPQNGRVPASLVSARISDHSVGTFRALTERDRLAVLVDSTTKAEVKRQIASALRLQKAVRLLRIHSLDHKDVQFSTNGKEVRATFRYGHQHWQKKEFRADGAGVAAIKSLNRQIKEFMHGKNNK